MEKDELEEKKDEKNEQEEQEEEGKETTEAEEEKEEEDDFGLGEEDNEDEEGQEEEEDPEAGNPETRADSQSNENKQNAKRRINKKVQGLNEALEKERKENQKLRTDKKVTEEEKAAYKDLEEAEFKKDPEEKQLVKPKAEDFDLEDEDPKFVKAMEEWEDAVIDRKVSKKVSGFLDKLKLNTQQTAEKTKKQVRQDEHFLRVEESGNKNYDKEQTAVIKVLGAKNVSDIIDLFDDSDKIISNLAYDPDSMEGALDAVENGDLIGLVRIMERASKRKKGKTRKVTQPDNQLPASSSSDGSGKKYHEEGATFT